MNIGQELLSEIIEAGLVRAECKDLIVWASNSDEVLEAIAFKFAPELIRQAKDRAEIHAS